MEKLTESEIQEALAGVPDWSELNGAIQRTFQFKDFAEAMRFVDEVAVLAERLQHHPDILIRWNKVTLTLSTHDASGITHKDFDLARKIDALMGPPPTPVAAGKGRKKP
jgi:4a-hydroxytetrahydrobiopterin dehydratase